MSTETKDKIGGAILGFFGAIKICEREGYEPKDVFGIVLRFIEEQKQNVIES